MSGRLCTGRGLPPPGEESTRPYCLFWPFWVLWVVWVVWVALFVFFEVVLLFWVLLQFSFQLLCGTSGRFRPCKQFTRSTSVYTQTGLAFLFIELHI